MKDLATSREAHLAANARIDELEAKVLAHAQERAREEAEALAQAEADAAAAAAALEAVPDEE